MESLSPTQSALDVKTSNVMPGALPNVYFSPVRGVVGAIAAGTASYMMGGTSPAIIGSLIGIGEYLVRTGFQTTRPMDIAYHGVRGGIVFYVGDRIGVPVAVSGFVNAAVVLPEFD